ncbi:hypothetical protein N9D88_02920 [Alphaproteobacteria bacterium]|nr:hypothetical protein [Alphaproteobacteria bacterium]
MTVLDTLNFVAFNPLQNNNPIAVRRRKLIAKIDEQILLSQYNTTRYGKRRKNVLFIPLTNL